MRRRVMDHGIDANTLMLLHGEDFTDSSSEKLTIINSGITINSDGKFDKCFYIPNSTRMRIDSLKLPISEFSFDCWVKVLSYSAEIQTIISNGKGSIEVSIFKGKLRLVKEYIVDLGAASTNFPLNKWTHVYVTKTNGSAKAYIDGLKVIDSACSLNAGTGVMIGGHKSALNDSPSMPWSLNGYLDEVRISKTVRWTSNFTPPTNPY